MEKWRNGATHHLCTRLHKVGVAAVYPTIKDVAKRAGVSPSTVSRVIADHPRISRATKERVRAAMRELNYQPNAAARSLVRRRTQTIGVALSRSTEAALANPFFPEVLRGIGAAARLARYSLTLTTATSYDEERQQCMELLTQRRVDGLIVLASHTDDPLIDWLDERGHPFVVLGRVPGRDVPHVNNDNVAAAREATQHLLELGHRRIAFVGGPLDFIVTLDRLEGYKQALQEAGLAVDPRLVVTTDFSYEQAYEAARRLLTDSSLAGAPGKGAGGVSGRPTAFVAIDDGVALGVLAAAKSLGLRVPEQVSVVGFNDSPVCPHVAPPLTSVFIPVFDMGFAAAQMLCDILAGKRGSRAVSLATRLVVRQSTAPLRGALGVVGAH